jgi:TIGR01777 family protein
MIIAVSGATGYIGTALSRYLTMQGNKILPLWRSLFESENNGKLRDIISCSDVVINLAGASINRRWNKKNKEVIFSSRVKTTSILVDAIRDSSPRPGLLISASAVGYYGDNDTYDEYNAVKGNGFLAGVCEAWENEAQEVSSLLRVAITRFGVVLSPDGGAMAKILKPVKLFKVAPGIGPGTQPFPWISLADLCRAMQFLIEHSSLSGVFNFVSPQIVTYSEFVKKTGKNYGALFSVNLPEAVIKLIMGESASILTSGQRVIPRRLQDAGFTYESPCLDAFFEKADSTHASVKSTL